MDYREDRVTKRKERISIEEKFNKLIKLSRAVAYSKGPFDEDRALLELRSYLEELEKNGP